MTTPEKPSKGLTYAAAGVNLDAADDFLARIRAAVASTHTPAVKPFTHRKGRNPWVNNHATFITGNTDGAGTKTLLALQYDRLDGIGQDTVAMCDNDALVNGGQGVFFMNYLGCHKMHPERAARLVRGFAGACKTLGIPVLGGENAEMPGVYAEGAMEQVGFEVSALNQALFCANNPEEGMPVYGVRSSGVHANGFSLVRRILAESGINPLNPIDEVDPNRPVIDVLLEPTVLYRPILKDLLLSMSSNLHGLAHITGGGLVEKPAKLLPEDLAINFDELSFDKPLPPLFAWLQRMGNVSDFEMRRTFNCGWGMVFIAVNEIIVNELTGELGLTDNLHRIGTVTRRAPNGPAVTFNPA